MSESKTKQSIIRPALILALALALPLPLPLRRITRQKHPGVDVSDGIALGVKHGQQTAANLVHAAKFGLGFRV
jgi:hypothetical protein